MNDSTSQRTQLQTRLRTALVCGAPAVLFFAISLIGLDRIPYFGNDEVYPASTAWTFVTQGRFAREITDGSLGTNVFDAYPPLWILLLSGVFKAFGVGIWTTRVPSIAVAALAIAFLSAAVFSVTRSNLKALAASVLYSLDPILLQRARIGRMEPLAVMFICAGIWATCQRSRLAWWLAGLCFTCAVASYQFAALSAVAWMIGLGVARDWRRASWVVLGGGSGILLWTIWLWGHGPELHAQVLDTGKAYTEPALLAFVHEWQRYYNLYVALRAPSVIPVYALAPLAAAAWFACSNLPLVRVVCAACISEIALLAFVGMKSSSFYFMFASPLVYFVLASSLDAAPRPSRLLARGLAVCSLAGGILVLAGLGLKLKREWSCRDAVAFDAKAGLVLDRVIASGKTIVGPSSLWLPTIRRRGFHRVIFDAEGPHTEPLLKGFVDNAPALAAAGVIALDEGAEDLIRRYPALQNELKARTKTLEITNDCHPNSFTMSLFERGLGRVDKR
jgi:hypothetical protein